MIRRVLEGIADEIYECSGTDEAYMAYDRFRPEWTVLDAATAEGDGIEVTRKIKVKFPDARIIILSDYDDFEIERFYRGAGASIYVTKDDLSAIRKHLTAPPAGPRSVTRGQN